VRHPPAVEALRLVPHERVAPVRFRLVYFRVLRRCASDPVLALNSRSVDRACAHTQDESLQAQGVVGDGSTVPDDIST